MPEYRVQVYKIWWADEPNIFYVGSTKKRLLSERMSQHRWKCRNGKSSRLYEHMRNKGQDFEFVLLGWSMVSSFDEQRMVEQRFKARLNPSLNMINAFTTTEERSSYLKERENYRPDRSEYHRTVAQTSDRQQYLKEYYEIQRQNVRVCICGGTYNYGHLHKRERHYRTAKHRGHTALIYAKLRGETQEVPI